MKNYLYIIILIILSSSCALEKSTFHTKKFQRGFVYGKKQLAEQSELMASHMGEVAFQQHEKTDEILVPNSYEGNFDVASNGQDDFIGENDIKRDYTYSKNIVTADTHEQSVETVQLLTTDNDLEREASSDSKIAFGLFLGAIAVGTIALTVSSLSHMLIPLLGAAFLFSILALVLAAKARRKTSLPHRRTNMGLIMVFSALIGGALLAILGFSILALL